MNPIETIFIPAAQDLKSGPVLQKIDSLKEGEALIIIINRDAANVLDEVINLKGTSFSWKKTAYNPEDLEVKVFRTVTDKRSCFFDPKNHV